MKKWGKYASLDEGNGFGSPKILQFAATGERCIIALHPPQKQQRNMI
jgi:hypothetical protein